MSRPTSCLKTDHLTIIAFDDKHLNESYLSWLNDPKLMRYSEQRHKDHSLESCKSYLCSFDGSDNYFLAIEDHKGNMLGTMTVYQDTHNQLADIGIMIGSPDARGKGYGFEAWEAVMNWVIDNLKPRKLTGGCMKSNQAMIKIMKKSGMQPDGFRHEHFLRDGQLEDILYMAKFCDISD